MALGSGTEWVGCVLATAHEDLGTLVGAVAARRGAAFLVVVVDDLLFLFGQLLLGPAFNVSLAVESVE